MGDRRYKRNEAFRYDFGKPLNCEYRQIKVVHDNIEIKSAPNAGEILNISPNGLQLSSEKGNRNLKNGEKVEFTFTLATEPFVMIGEVVWEKNEFHSTLYGVKFLTLGMEKAIVDDLKKFAKNQLKK
ncbi:PilZ domain-containing protein [Alkalihalobacterium elongatum]|uniref:PilZ domain-containing protein n=1 Tax=Alkalihalobacterium elongatum TaxID=2675466 RepID=UPI001C2004B2|nr:PilZ domain-containing protein [Alkalihalobacterium elongatum]